jgi:5S rRNA maturation endonuclease (ribonuclease M5)
MKSAKESYELKQEIEKFKDCVILVEGGNDVIALKNSGFEKVYAIHRHSKGLRERIEEIVNEAGRDRVYCILMDLDDAGKKFYLEIKKILQELGVNIDTKFRGILTREKVSHLEGFDSFMDKLVE